MDFQEVVSATRFRSPFKVRQPRLWILCSLILPVDVSSNLPALTVAKMSGTHLLGWHFEPQKGEYFAYEGNIWRTCHRPIQFPARFQTKGAKEPPYLTTEYVTGYESDLEMITTLLDLFTNS